mgnify:CR=1 FL=1
MLSNNSVIKTICLLICFFAYSVYSLKANAQVIRVGLIDYPPHINFDENLSKSPLYQYINRTLQPLGYTIKFVKLPRERATIELVKGRVDVLMPVPLENESMKILSLPIFHSVPGLCFKKENFIPILSAIHRLDDLTIGVPVSSTIVAGLSASKANLLQIKGENATNRGIEMTQRGWLDAFYHPSPVKVYHRKNPSYKEVACSYFHGYSTPVYIAISNTLPKETFNLINSTYQKAITKESYEYYFASRK